MKFLILLITCLSLSLLLVPQTRAANGNDINDKSEAKPSKIARRQDKRNLIQLGYGLHDRHDGIAPQQVYGPPVHLPAASEPEFIPRPPSPPPLPVHVHPEPPASYPVAVGSLLPQPVAGFVHHGPVPVQPIAGPLPAPLPPPLTLQPIAGPVPVPLAPPLPVVQTITKPVPVPVFVPRPYPVHVEKLVHVDRPVHVQVPVEVPVPKPVPVAYPVDRYVRVDRPYPVHVAVPVHVPKPYPVPVAIRAYYQPLKLRWK